ncbi:MAG: hypothetical protein WD035_09970 [Balneolaceae bacterium]
MTESTVEKKPNKHKKWIVLLLSVTCLISVILYLEYQPAGNHQLRHTEQIDSLITRTFDRFNISFSQVRKQSILLDSLTERVVYTVDVAPGFSKTRWHYELDKQVRDYGIQTPSKVQFPDRDIRVHLTYGSTVVRSVILRTDPDRVLYRDFAALILAFDRPPEPEVLNRIITLGEPIHVAIRSDAPRQDYPSLQEVRRKYPRTLWILQESNGDSFNHPDAMNPYLSHVSRVHQIDSGATILFLNPYPENLPVSLADRMSKFNVEFIDAGEALYIEELSEIVNIQQITNRILAESSVRKPPILIIEGNDANIGRLQEFITSLTEQNIQLRNPSTNSF